MQDIKTNDNFHIHTKTYHIRYNHTIVSNHYKYDEISSGHEVYVG